MPEISFFSVGWPRSSWRSIVSLKQTFCPRRLTRRNSNGRLYPATLCIFRLYHFLSSAGTSVVSIRNTKSEDGTVRFESWSSSLASAMNVFFDCQHYSTTFRGSNPKVEFSFYGMSLQAIQSLHDYINILCGAGLAEQTVAAAYALEMVTFFLHN